ncbi:MAG: hypothetical protein KKA19_08920 [Candidatus Margulisbacteria bacterium]|nr:hypothetical protein [Candidatus Margulisiibacteriota bacterium]
MGGIYFLIPTLLVIFISFLIVRAGAIGLMMTGLDEARAHFQSLSAYSGTGFTTKEAEYVMNHPVRRKIVTWLMILGNAGIVTVIVTATTSLVTSQGVQLSINIFVFLIGIFIIYKIANNRGFTRRWESFIEDKFIKLHAFEEGTTEDLLHLIEGYGLVKVQIRKNSPLIGDSLSKHRLSSKGLLVLGIERGNKWVPIPKATKKLKEGDTLIVYGSLKILRSVFNEKEEQGAS